eukprot:m.110692 g.110692  ORF g.110692 m.110692 type:complete len:99 (+) comp12897_c0_seq4:49-345(+)
MLHFRAGVPMQFQSHCRKFARVTKDITCPILEVCLLAGPSGVVVQGSAVVSTHSSALSRSGTNVEARHGRVAQLGIVQGCGVTRIGTALPDRFNTAPD